MTVTCRGLDFFTSSNDSLSIILFSPATCTGSKGHPSELHLRAGLSVPAEIYDQLTGLPGVEPEMVPLAPVYKVINKFSVGSVNPSLMRQTIAELSENFCRWQ